MTPELGTWQRVTSGPHRGRTGVVDLIKTEGAGTRYRLSHPHLKEPVGRFPAEMLEPIAAPVYESKVDAQTTQKALGLLMKGAAS